MGIWPPATLTPNDGWGPLPPHATPPPRRSALRWLERLLLVVGIACLGYYGYVSAEAALYQAYETRELDAILASVPPPPTPALETSFPASPEIVEPARKQPAPGSMLGRLEIPRLRVAAIV